jgi:AcrR family transcriptional regulator
MSDRLTFRYAYRIHVSSVPSPEHEEWPVRAERPAPRGRPREPETDRRIIGAALELLQEKGPAAVNVEAVAARAGIAKTTIYRRYRDREDLVRTVVDRITDQPLPPPDLPPREKLRWVLIHVREAFDGGLGRGGVAALLTDEDPEFTDHLRRSLDAHLSPLKAVIAADSRAGLLRSDLDADILINVIVGSYLGELLRYGQPRERWLERTLDELLPALSRSD